MYMYTQCNPLGEKTHDPIIPRSYRNNVFCFQALKVLRCAEFAPFVVFIAAPTITGMNDMHVS